jgi:hypothetical protein
MDLKLLPCSQEAIIGPYIESDTSKSYPLFYPTALKVILVLRSYLRLYIRSDLFS